MTTNQVPPVQTVSQLMRRDPVTIIMTASVREALALMNCRGIRHLIAVTTESKLAGVLSQRDILKYTLQTGGRTFRVRDAMTAPVICATPDMSITEAARLLCEKRIGSLPVLSPAAKIIGILTRSDFVRVVASLTCSVPAQGLPV